MRLDDPFPDPPGLNVPPSSPTRPPDNSTRIAEDEDPLATLPEEEEERIRREKAAAASALTLEMVGDLPFANVRPPENVLFVCKLNPVTRDEDLELIFSRFGTIMSCQVIRDKKTGDSLQYAFIEFDKREDAEQVSLILTGPSWRLTFVQAYFKMQNVLVDDRRIWVDLYVSWFSSFTPFGSSTRKALNPLRKPTRDGRMILPGPREVKAALEAGMTWSRPDDTGERIPVEGGMEEAMEWCLMSLATKNPRENGVEVATRRARAAENGQDHVLPGDPRITTGTGEGTRSVGEAGAESGTRGDMDDIEIVYNKVGRWRALEGSVRRAAVSRPSVQALSSGGFQSDVDEMGLLGIPNCTMVEHLVSSAYRLGFCARISSGTLWIHSGLHVDDPTKCLWG